MKKFALVFLACFFLSLHYGAILYVNSTLLNGFFSSTGVSGLFFLGALGNIVLFFLIPKLLRKFGSKMLLLASILISAASTFSLAVAVSPTVVAVSFVVYSSLLAIIFYLLDLFLEDISADLMTGEIRGAWLAVIHLGLIAGLVFLSVFSGAENILKPVYLVAGFLLLPPLFLTSFFRSKIQQSSGIGGSATLPFATWWHTKSIRKVTLARSSLEFFYAFMTIYTPLYLNSVLGFGWGTIGIMFAIALLPFILFQWPAGKLADIFIGEKEMLIVGFVCMGISLLIMPSLGTSVVAWTMVLLLSRIGASLVETMSDSYFFKHVDSGDAGLLSIFRLTRPTSVALGAASAALMLKLVSFEKIFFILAIVVFFGLKEALLIRDTK